MKKFKNYISKQGLELLFEEQNHLLHVQRPETCKVVTWAASNGDRSENADYQYGKRRLREIDRRLRFLSKRITNAQVVDFMANSDKTIRFGAYVQLRDENEQIKNIFIVGIDEIDTAKGKISWQSPLGKILIGKTIDDEIELKTPTGVISYLIVDVDYKTWP